LRYDKLCAETVENCLMCGRCNIACPVGIDLNELRQVQRNKFSNISGFNYDYLPRKTQAKADVLYFAGCMTHLTPAIKKSMEKILVVAGVNYKFLDQDGSICCGRPLMLAGQFESARAMIGKNSAIIQSTEAKTFVTSCPICYRIFKEDYRLDIEVLHHSQFIFRLIETEKISVKRTDKRVFYHDPCELGRGSNIYVEPRAVINHIASLFNSEFEGKDSLCCGGSIGNIKLQNEQRNLLSIDALNKLGINQINTLITSCPLCKKTFNTNIEKEVKDIAELVAGSLVKSKEREPKIAVSKPLHSVVYERQ
jgi:Fe-S oxidoreductase